MRGDTLAPHTKKKAPRILCERFYSFSFVFLPHDMTLYAWRKKKKKNEIRCQLLGPLPPFLLFPFCFYIYNYSIEVNLIVFYSAKSEMRHVNVICKML